jgi:hypothetical protein
MILAGYQFPHGAAAWCCCCCRCHCCCLHLAGTHKLRRVMLGAAGSAHHDRNKHRFLLPNTSHIYILLMVYYEYDISACSTAWAHGLFPQQRVKSPHLVPWREWIRNLVLLNNVNRWDSLSQIPGFCVIPKKYIVIPKKYFFQSPLINRTGYSGAILSDTPTFLAYVK